MHAAPITALARLNIRGAPVQRVTVLASRTPSMRRMRPQDLLTTTSLCRSNLRVHCTAGRRGDRVHGGSPGVPSGAAARGVLPHARLAAASLPMHADGRLPVLYVPPCRSTTPGAQVSRCDVPLARNRRQLRALIAGGAAARGHWRAACHMTFMSLQCVRCMLYIGALDGRRAVHSTDLGDGRLQLLPWLGELPSWHLLTCTSPSLWISGAF